MSSNSYVCIVQARYMWDNRYVTVLLFLYYSYYYATRKLSMWQNLFICSDALFILCILDITLIQVSMDFGFLYKENEIGFNDRVSLLFCI